MARKNRIFAKLASNVNIDGGITADGIAPSVSLGGSVTSYDSAGILPFIGNSVGDQAFAADTDRLYIWNGSGWYSISLINATPTVTTNIVDDEAQLTDSDTTLNFSASDTDGTPILWSYSLDNTASGYISNVRNDSNGSFTLSYDSNGIYTDGQFTARASDGINIGAKNITILVPVAGTGYIYLNHPDGTFGENVTRTSIGVPTSSAGIASQTIANESFEINGSGDYLKYVSSVPTSFTSSNSYKFVWAINIPFQNDIGIGMSCKDNGGSNISLVTYNDKVVAFQGTGTTSRRMSPPLATSQWYIMTVDRSFALASLFRAKTPGGTPYSIDCVTSGGGYAPPYASSNNTLLFSGQSSGQLSGFTSRSLMEQRIAGVALYPTTMTDDEILNEFDTLIFG